MTRPIRSSSGLSCFLRKRPSSGRAPFTLTNWSVHSRRSSSPRCMLTAFMVARALYSSALSESAARPPRRLEVQPPDKLARLLRPVLAAHARVLELDRQRSIVADFVQRANHPL